MPWIFITQEIFLQHRMTWAHCCHGNQVERRWGEFVFGYDSPIQLQTHTHRHRLKLIRESLWFSESVVCLIQITSLQSPLKNHSVSFTQSTTTSATVQFNSVLRHFLRQHVCQDVDGVGLGFGCGSSSQQDLEQCDLNTHTHKQGLSEWVWFKCSASGVWSDSLSPYTVVNWVKYPGTRALWHTTPALPHPEHTNTHRGCIQLIIRWHFAALSVYGNSRRTEGSSDTPLL